MHACFLKDRQRPGSITPETWGRLLEIYEKVLRQDTADKHDLDVFEHLDTTVVDLPPFPQEYAQQIFDMERKMLEIKLGHLKDKKVQDDMDDAQLRWVYGYVSRMEASLQGEKQDGVSFRYEVNFRRAQFRANGEIRSLQLPKNQLFSLPADPTIYKLKDDPRRAQTLLPVVGEVKAVIQEIQREKMQREKLDENQRKEEEKSRRVVRQTAETIEVVEEHSQSSEEEILRVSQPL